MKRTTRGKDERTFNPAATASQARGEAQQFQTKQNRLKRLAQARAAAFKQRAGTASTRGNEV